MSAASYIAFRYMKTHKGNRFFSWIGALSIAGIAIGVAAMIVVLSVINGFEIELRNRFLAANAHILAFHYPAGLENHHGWMSRIRNDFGDVITGMSPFVQSETMARKNSLMHSVMIRGIDPEKRNIVQPSDYLIKPEGAMKFLQQELNDAAAGKAPPEVPAVILGSGLLSLLNAKVDEMVELVDPESKQLGAMKKFKVVGVYDSGLKHYDNKLALISLTTAQSFFRMGQRVTGIEIGLIRPQDSIVIAREMEKHYTISIKDWQSFNNKMFEAMEMERAVIALIVALVAFVASFNILTTLFISVSQKQKGISILKALGANHFFVQRVFLLQGLYIGVVGSAIGMALAYGISQALSRYQFIDLPDLYLLSRLPIAMSPLVYVTVAVCGILVCVAAGIYPAWVASRVTITEGVRGNA